MLLRLASTFNSIEDFENPQFDLRSKDDDHNDVHSLQDFLQDLRAVERYDEMISEVQFIDDVSENEFVDAETYVNPLAPFRLLRNRIYLRLSSQI